MLFRGWNQLGGDKGGKHENIKEKCKKHTENVLSLRFSASVCRRKNYFRFFRGSFLYQVVGSSHIQWSNYIVFHEESDFQVKNKQILEPEGNKSEKRT